MAYNNDVNTIELFEKVYEMFGAGDFSEYKVIEISYAVGLFAGIVIFYNHFAGKKFTSDPTPIQVEMDKYESDIDTCMIDRSNCYWFECGRLYSGGIFCGNHQCGND